MNVLITGAGGFIGTHLVKAQLGKDRGVTAVDVNVDSLTPFLEHPRLQVVHGDFRNSQLLDHLLGSHQLCFQLASIHLQTHVSESEYLAVNAEGASEFVRRCDHAGIGRFVHCSSVGVHGNIRHPPANEDTPPSPDNVYERSKWLGEQRVMEYAREHDYPVVVVRPAWVYGPGCPRTLKLIRSIQSGRFFYVGNGDTLRHPIFIEDMLHGFELAGTHPDAPGQVFIMAGPKAVSIRELVETIAGGLNVASPSGRVPRSLAWLGGWGLETAFGLAGRSAPFSRRSLKFFIGNTAFSMQKAQAILDFTPRVSLQEGMERTLQATAA